MMNSDMSPRWADRLGPVARTTMIIVLIVLGIFVIGMIGGFGYAISEEGRIPNKPIVWLIFAAMPALLAGISWVLLGLFRSIHPGRMSGFDRRYWTMWTWVIGMSIPIGAALAIFGLGDQSKGFTLVLSNSPIHPWAAILLSVAIALLLTTTLVFYFRAIDDHEARAYLWGSNVAFHFIALAFPLYWLLARGGLVPVLTIGLALLIVLASCIVQAIVWALFKFR